MKTMTVALAASCALQLVGCSSGPVPPTKAPVLACASYTVTDLGVLGAGSYSKGGAIDDDGAVTGFSYMTADGAVSHGYYSACGRGMVDVGALTAGSNSLGNAVRNHVVVGASETANHNLHAFSWTLAGGLVDLGTLGGSGSYDQSEAYGVNASGVAVGMSLSPSGFQHAVQFSGGRVVDLDPILGGSATSSSTAVAINDSGVIVGTTDKIAYSYDGTTVTELGAISPSSISHGGVIAGSIISGRTQHPAIYRNGAIIDLGLPSAFSTATATAANDRDQVVGTGLSTGLQAGQPVAFISNRGALANLTTLVHGWQITSANGINNAGAIAATGIPLGASSQAAHALVLAPDEKCNHAP